MGISMLKPSISSGLRIAINDGDDNDDDDYDDDRDQMFYNAIAL